MAEVEDLQRPLLNHEYDHDRVHGHLAADSSPFKSIPRNGDDIGNGYINRNGDGIKHVHGNGNSHGNGRTDIALDIPHEAHLGKEDESEDRIGMIDSTVNASYKDESEEENEEIQGETHHMSSHTDTSELARNDGINGGLYSFLGERPASPPMPTLDPFRNHTETISNAYEWIKTFLCLPVAIIRLLLIIVITVIGVLFAKVVLVGWTDKHLPMPKWRRRLIYVTRLLARAFLFFLGYHWINRRGKQSKREVAPIIVSNHVSFIDPIFFFYELFPSFVSSASHSDLPGIGMIIRPMQVINVDRSSSESKKYVLKEIKNRAMNNDYPHVMLFPEGTTTNGRSLIFFQHGAFIPGLPIQPVVLRYPYVHFDNSWGRISILKIVFRMFTQFHNFMEVEYLPIVYPSPREKDHPKLFAKKVKNVMAKALNVAETEYSFNDLILSEKMNEHKNTSATPYIVEMAWWEKVFCISTKEAIIFLEKFQKMDSDNRGWVSKDQFLEGLELPKTAFSEQIFDFFDTEEQSAMSFQGFLEGSAFISKHPSFERFCRIAFQSCDLQNQGYLSNIEVDQTLCSVLPEISPLQVQKMCKKLDFDGDGLVTWADFRTFLGKNPELLALFLPQSMSLSIV